MGRVPRNAIRDGSVYSVDPWTRRGQWRCEKCDKTFTAYRYLLQHKKEEHSY